MPAQVARLARMSDSPLKARADASLDGDVMVVKVGGDWRIIAQHPAWEAAVATWQSQPRVIIQADQLGWWDSSLALYLRAARVWGEATGIKLTIEGMPNATLKLADLLDKKCEPPPTPSRVPDLFTALGKAAFKLWAETKDLAQLVGDCVFSTGRFFRGQAQFRWRDCFSEMQQCGAMALPIVGLISFLVGVTLAYTGSIVVRQYGGDIWIADMVGLAVVREMGPMMAAIVLAGRTG